MQYRAVFTLDGIPLKPATQEALRHFQGVRHQPAEIAEIVLHIDGGGARAAASGNPDEQSPATWAVIVCTRGHNYSMAFDRFFGGSVITDPAGQGYIGAENASSMTAEISAQVHCVLFALSNPLRAQPKTPVSIVFDNHTAAKFAMSVASTKKNLRLHATVGVVSQILSMHTPVAWGHAYSHMGEGMNELADSIVAVMADTPGMRDDSSIPCSTWCQHYETASIKLMYLLFLPRHLAHAYPPVNPERTALMATPTSKVKWGYRYQCFAAGLMTRC